jgi:hypothetical protein
MEIEMGMATVAWIVALIIISGSAVALIFRGMQERQKRESGGGK